MKKYKLILSLLVVLFWCFNAYPATQTINTLPDSNATFISDNQTFLGNEQANREALQANNTDIKVISGGIGATDASLTHTISEVTAFPNGFYVNDAAVSHTYTASKRTFVYVRDSDSRTITISGAAITYDGNFVFAETVSSTAYPGSPAGTLPLFYADTDGTSITAVVDYRGEFINSSIYYIDFKEVDQGITGNSRTIKTYVDSIGSDNAVLYFRNNSGNATTTYTLTTSETIPSNITLNFEPGAIIDGAGTLTINGSLSAQQTQIFGSSLTVDGSPKINSVYSEWFGTVGDGATDDTTALQKAIDFTSASKIGILDLFNRIYRTTSVVTLKRSVWLRGVGAINSAGPTNGLSVIYGDHTGNAILSLQGNFACKITDVMLSSEVGNVPKTGLLLGRDSAASAGYHYIERLNIQGYFSVAGIYSIASESNTWNQIFMTLVGGGGQFGFYTSQGDNFSVDATLVASSNIDNTITGMGIISKFGAGSSGIYIDGGISTGGWTFNSCYTIVTEGDYVTLRNGASDGQDTLGGIAFFNCGGELFPGGTPDNGYNIIGTQSIRGLTIIGGRYQFTNDTGNERIIKQAATVTLKQPNIQLQDMDNADTELQQNLIIDGHVSVGTQSFIAPSLLNSWVTTFATTNGLQVPGYIKDPNGYVEIRGIASGGTVGSAIFQLPAGYRPALPQFFICNNAAAGTSHRVEVNATGDVILSTGGSNTYISFSGIRFKAIN